MTETKPENLDMIDQSQPVVVLWKYKSPVYIGDLFETQTYCVSTSLPKPLLPHPHVSTTPETFLKYLLTSLKLKQTKPSLMPLFWMHICSPACWIHTNSLHRASTLQYSMILFTQRISMHASSREPWMLP